MTTHDESKGPEGYDVTAVEAWIAEHVEGLAPPFKWTRLLGGHSNLTYRLDDSIGRLAVIRRPPQGELLPKAHDMSREWALISALGPTAVPVPSSTPVLATIPPATATDQPQEVMWQTLKIHNIQVHTKTTSPERPRR